MASGRRAFHPRGQSDTAFASFAGVSCAASVRLKRLLCTSCPKASKTTSLVFLGLTQVRHREQGANIRLADMREKLPGRCFFALTIARTLDKAGADDRKVLVTVKTIGVQASQKLIYRCTRHLHIDADDGGPVFSDTVDRGSVNTELSLWRISPQFRDA